MIFPFLFFGWCLATHSADLAEGQAALLAGDYSGTVALAKKELADRPGDEGWQLLLSRALLTTGQYGEALTAMTNALARDPDSLPLRWQAREVFQSNGQSEAANQMTASIMRRFTADPRNYRDPASLVVFGQAALSQRADPKRVLDQLFETAKRADPKLRDVYLASGGLALEKHDFALAAKRFEEGLKQLPDDADLHYGLARAFAASDDSLMLDALNEALGRNSNHVGSLLLMADHEIDAEDYPEAEKLLARVQAINPWSPEALAYRAAAAHLQNQPEKEATARKEALKFWPDNPRVDYLIGLKLSQKYRFAEGSAHQRQALEYVDDYLPSKIQLAQDLLRLGEETEGWALAQEVSKQDGYDVEAYNLATLHDTMKSFATLTNQDFILRMGRHEAEVYGARVLDLLSRARSNLCAKFDFQVKRPTIVEVFPEQKDFAVRTFGMPGNSGYLGVCFGSVVTANSPAARVGHAVNWEAVLWHEFCHVVTLQNTRNKMPRWLSEGISVYEELQANPAWGQRMTPHYREMILGDELTPVGKLSGAFLAPPTERHLQFAYYEASLVVEFVIQRYGLDALKAILRDLGEGMEINRSIEKRTAPMAKIEEEFAAFAKKRAEDLAPGLDWEKPEFAREESKDHPAKGAPDDSSDDDPPDRGTNSKPKALIVRASDEARWEEWAKTRPTNFWVMTRQAQKLVQEKNWSQAKPILQHIVELFPDFVGGESAYRSLAAAHRGLGETNAERQVLARFAEKDDEAADAYARLMELAEATEDWTTVLTNAERYLAVNPLVKPPYRFLAEAAEKTGSVERAIGAYLALAQLEPANPAEVQYHLARLMKQSGKPEARRHLLQALEEAPRYREALRLLLEMNGESPRAQANGSPGDPKP